MIDKLKEWGELILTIIVTVAAVCGVILMYALITFIRLIPLIIVVAACFGLWKHFFA